MSEPADVAALIASYAKPKYLGARERNPMMGDIVMISVETARATAAALQSQQERIAELEGSCREWEGCLIRANEERDAAEARVAELEAALQIFDPGLNSLDANKVPPLQINEQSR